MSRILQSAPISTSAASGCPFASNPIKLERLYLSIHSSLPRSTTTNIGGCPFNKALTRSISTSAPSFDSTTDPKFQQAQTKETIIPSGNCPFRWSDLLSGTLKEKFENFTSPLPKFDESGYLPLNVDGTLNYDKFFARRIQDKKDDKSYRQFRVLARNASHFPTAKHFKDPTIPVNEGRDITVWCSNDYMGMSKHPDVQQATM
jgi:5-aminolevulinate synthase